MELAIIGLDDYSTSCSLRSLLMIQVSILNNSILMSLSRLGTNKVKSVDISHMLCLQKLLWQVIHSDGFETSKISSSDASDHSDLIYWLWSTNNIDLLPFYDLRCRIVAT